MYRTGRSGRSRSSAAISLLSISGTSSGVSPSDGAIAAGGGAGIRSLSVSGAK
jgi:hypothetical protein